MASTDPNIQTASQGEALVASLNAAVEAGRNRYEWALQQMEAGVPEEEICIAVAIHFVHEPGLEPED